MTAEAGHFPNRVYEDQQGNLHLNGAAVYDANELEIDGSLTGLAASGAEITRNNQESTRVVSLTGSTAITAALHEGRDLLLSGTGAAYTQTLPAATGTGARYYFEVGAVNTSNHIVAAASSSDLFTGFVTLAKTGAAGAGEQFAANGSSNYKITLNGTTTGGSGVGGQIEFVDVALNQWLVNGIVLGSGTIATPFSG
jgi:hypothetical protein